MTFDSLTFARRLRAAGFSEAQAEALADANRDMLMPELATKGDIAAVRGDMTAMEQRLQAGLEALGLRLTIRLGVMIGAAIAILGAILRLH
jgi:hypothetical protein